MARATARGKGLALEHLVVDELIVLRLQQRMRPPMFRAKGGVGRIKTRISSVWLRLREVPGATMKTVVLKPWFERRNKHVERARQRARLHRGGDEPAGAASNVAADARVTPLAQQHAPAAPAAAAVPPL